MKFIKNYFLTMFSPPTSQIRPPSAKVATLTPIVEHTGRKLTVNAPIETPTVLWDSQVQNKPIIPEATKSSQQDTMETVMSPAAGQRDQRAVRYALTSSVRGVSGLHKAASERTGLPKKEPISQQVSKDISAPRSKGLTYLFVSNNPLKLAASERQQDATIMSEASSLSVAFSSRSKCSCLQKQWWKIMLST